MAIDVSVVVPTYNRLPRLKRTLAGLAAQVGVDGCVEVIVVSDGSVDGTDDWLRSTELPVPLVALSQPNAGPAVARNTGIGVATGEIVLFLDDDVVPEPNLVAAHREHHGGADRDLVVIGPMNTPSDLVLSPWVEWEQRMLYKQYAAMARGDWLPTARQFYTGNASVRRRHLEDAGGFDPSFRRAEDVELAYRLGDAGLEFRFTPDAVVLHYAERSFGSWRANASAYGHNDVIFARDHGRTWLLDAIGREFQDRHRLVRTLTRSSLRYPRFGRATTNSLALVARSTASWVPDSISHATLSLVYNVEYYCGMSDEMGDPALLLDMFEQARTE